MEFNLDNLKDTIRADATHRFPNECCGLIVFNDQYFTIKCENQSKSPSEHFLISIEETEAAKKQGSLVGYYHSHPKGDSMISELDKYVSERLNIFCVTYNAKMDSFYQYKPQNYEVPLANRPFFRGVFDCYTLVRDYYNRNLNITLEEMPDETTVALNEMDNNFLEFYNKFSARPNYYLDFLTRNGFRKVAERKMHDLILLKTSVIPYPIHCAVYLGGNQILHQPNKKLSCVTHLDNFYLSRVLHTLRHVKLT